MQSISDTHCSNLGACFMQAYKEKILQKFFYSPADAQVNYLKNNFKIYMKIDIKTAPTYFGAVTIIRERIIRAC
jgi:hypothetical protein